MPVHPDLKITTSASVFSLVSLPTRVVTDDEARATVERYLYSPTTIVEQGVFKAVDERIVFVLRTTVSSVDRAGEAHNGASLLVQAAVANARAQCDRLRSGTYVAAVIGDEDTARAEALEWAFDGPRPAPIPA